MGETKNILILLTTIGFLTTASAFQCYDCESAASDSACNEAVQNCTADSPQICLVWLNAAAITENSKTGTTTTKRCATVQDCWSNFTGPGEKTCCDSTLCNQATSFPVEDTGPSQEELLLGSVGSNPALFLSSVAMYQALSGLIYGIVVLFILYNTPRNYKGQASKVSPEYYDDNVVELE